VTSLGQFLADCGPKTTHSAGNESNTLRHSFSFLFVGLQRGKNGDQYMC
jgi:hypothetical protein